MSNAGSEKMSRTSSPSGRRGPGRLPAHSENRPWPQNADERLRSARRQARVINATGTFTDLGGSVMPPEVVAAWVEASKHFVNLVELQDEGAARSPS